MDHEDRERKFEQALQRHLRRDAAGARNEADARAAVPDEAGGAAECLDAATLAAFHEGTLAGSEMNASTEHIAGCSRCQQVLLLLEATDEIPLQVEMENDLKMGEPVLSTGASDVDYAARQKPSLTVTGQPTPASKAPHDISRGRGFKALRWAAPAGAMAAGFLIWIVVRDNKMQTLTHVENVEVAQQQPAEERPATPRALPASPAPEPPTKITQLDEKRKENSRAKQPAKDSGALRAPNHSSSAAIANEIGAAPSAASPRANVRQLPTNSRDYSSLEATENKPPKVMSRQADVSAVAASPAPASPDDARAKSAAPVAAPPAASNGALSRPANQRADAEHTYTTEITDLDGQPLVPTEQMKTNDRLEFSPSLKKVGAENAKIILAPKGRMRWRLLSAGRIERSSDGGVTWVAQNSGVNVELIGGSAPSNAVCWMFGRGGTILKTTDGGGHWTKVPWPDAGEIVGIQGLDAMHAIVYEGGLGLAARLATNDGGETWFRTNK
jgi:hypothetical protein